MAGGGGGAPVGVGGNHGGALSKRLKGRSAVSGGLMLTSMLDIMTTVLFFLLQNFSSVKADFQVGKDITLPHSSASQAPVPALQLVVTKTAILLDNQKLVDIVNGEIPRADLLNDGVTIRSLAIEMKKQKDRSQIQNQTDKDKWVGSIVMQADKDLMFNVLKKVIYTAGISDFVMFKMAVLKKDQG